MLFIELLKLKRNYSLPSVNINIFLSDNCKYALPITKPQKNNMNSEKLAKIFLQD